MERFGGPLQRDAAGETFGMVYQRPGTLQDAAVIELDNQGSAPVLIDSVDLVPDKHASPLTFTGAYIAPPSTPQEVGHVHDAGFPTAEGYCVPPTAREERAPILIVRIGPSAGSDVDGHRISRNNAVSVHYWTQDGQRFVAAFAVRFEYPNHP